MWREARTLRSGAACNAGHDFLDADRVLAMEPTSGLEPLTCRLRFPCTRAALLR
jgi:hypothetical protein